MKDLDNFSIAIVGLGLMGGSLAMALKQNRVGRRVLGMDADPAVVERARRLGAIDEAIADTSDADLIVLAMPVLAIVGWLREQGRRLRAEQIVLDLGSTKRAIVAAMAGVDAQCVGGHPMCGKETSGIETAEANLFHGAKFVLVPVAQTSEQTLGVARQLATRIGAQPLVMDADAHDRAVAAVSHLPYLLSVNLVNTVAALHDAHAPLLASSGYAGMTRLAASDTRMMSDIVASNREHILKMVDAFQAELSRLRAAVAGAEPVAQFEQARQSQRNAP